MQTMDNLKNNLGKSAVVWCFVVGAAILLTWGPLQGADFAWHLQIGKVAWQQKTTLPTDIFSFTELGRPWLYKDLVADLLLYAVYANAGVWGYWLLKILALMLMAWSYHRVFPSRQSPWIFLVVSLLMFGAVNYRVLERPLLFSLVCFAVLISLLERLRLSAPISTWREVISALLPIVLLQWLWVQLHREAMVGYAMLLCWTLGFGFAYVTRSWSWSKLIWGQAPSRNLAVGMALLWPLTMVLGLLNPSGIATFTSSFSVVGSEHIRQWSSEWQAISWVEFLRYFPFAATLSVLAVVGCLVRGLLQLRQPDRVSFFTTLGPCLILLLFAVLSIGTIRWIPYLSMFSAYCVGYLLWEFVSQHHGLHRRLHHSLSLVVTGGFVVALLLWPRTESWQIGINSNKIPEGALSFAEKHGLQGNVMHAFRFGGYLMWRLWPKIRVQVDGRNDMVYPATSLIESMQSQQQEAVFFRMQQRYGVSWVVASNHVDFLSHLFLARHPAWMMVYWSEAAVIYVEKSKYPQLSSLQYHHIHPVSVDESVYHAMRRWHKDESKLHELERELSRMLEASPAGIRSMMGMALFYHWRGTAFLQQRNLWLQRLQQEAGTHPTVRMLFRQLRWR